MMKVGSGPKKLNTTDRNFEPVNSRFTQLTLRYIGAFFTPYTAPKRSQNIVIAETKAYSSLNPNIFAGYILSGLPLGAALHRLLGRPDSIF